MAQISDLHIEDFCKDAAKTLILLYKHFPQKMTLYVDDICGADTPDEFGLHSARFVACFDTILWLAQTDYIHYEQAVKQESLEGVTLSHRAFTFLASIENNHTLHDATPAPKTRIAALRDTLLNNSSIQLSQFFIGYMKESRGA